MSNETNKEKLPTILEGTEAKKLFDLLEKSDDKEVLKLRKEISQIEVNEQEVLEFLGE